MTTTFKTQSNGGELRRELNTVWAELTIVASEEAEKATEFAAIGGKLNEREQRIAKRAFEEGFLKALAGLRDGSL